MNSEETDYYQLLGIDRGAATDEIRDAYHQLARLYHPDSNFYDEIISDDISGNDLQKFKAITAAYNTLVSERKRREYDKTLPGGSLCDWDDEPVESPGASSETGLNRQYNPSAFGTFGRVKEARRPSPTGECVRSMSEIINTRRTIYRRILSVFGL